MRTCLGKPAIPILEDLSRGYFRPGQSVSPAARRTLAHHSTSHPPPGRFRHRPAACPLRDLRAGGRAKRRRWAAPAAEEKGGEGGGERHPLLRTSKQRDLSPPCCRRAAESAQGTPQAENGARRPAEACEGGTEGGGPGTSATGTRRPPVPVPFPSIASLPASLGCPDGGEAGGGGEAGARSRALLRPRRQDPPQLEPRPLAPSSGAAAAAAAAAGGDSYRRTEGTGRHPARPGWRHTEPPPRGAPRVRPLAQWLGRSLSRNRHGFQNGGFAGGEKEAGRRRPISAGGAERRGAGRA